MTVKVHVGNGDGLKTFIIHKQLGISRSPFFANALREGSTWASAEDGVIWLRKEDPEVFAVYMQLIYHNRIPVDEVMAEPQFREMYMECADPEDAYIGHVKEVTAKRCELLANLYVFCDMMQDIRAKNQVISTFVEEISFIAELAGGEWIAYPYLSAICIVYRHTQESDPLRKLFADRYISKASGSWVAGNAAKNYPKEFLYDVMVGMARRRNLPRFSSRVIEARMYYQKSDN
jgi:hypothetical protein